MTEWRRECACGGIVHANPDDPFPGVAFHNAQEPHRSWSDWYSLVPRTEDPDPTAPGAPVDLSGREAVRPVEVPRLPGHGWGVA